MGTKQINHLLILLTIWTGFLLTSWTGNYNLDWIAVEWIQLYSSKSILLYNLQWITIKYHI